MSRNDAAVVTDGEAIVVYRTAFAIGKAASALRSSQSNEALRLPRTGDLDVPRDADCDPMDLVSGRRSRHARGQLERIAGSPLAGALRERFGLTRMEAVVACEIAEGMTYAEMARRLAISSHTVHSHVKEIHLKLGVHSNGRAAALIRRLDGQK